MPFFRELTTINHKKNVTLQVQIPFMKKRISEKRVLSSASLKRKQGSMTIEAAMVLPLFLFAMIILMMPMKLLNDSRKVQTALEITGEELSQYVYVLNELKKGETLNASGLNELPDEFLGALTEQGVLLYARMRLEKLGSISDLSELSFSRSSVLRDNETIDLILDYRVSLPFSVFGLKSIKMTARCRKRAWIGNTPDSGEETDQREEMVYVGKNSTRYHKKRTCHYLYNNIKAVQFADLDHIRNSSGGKYKPCSRCAEHVDKDGVIYIMPSGGKYHSSENCSAITAYVRLVPLSQVAHLGACSYCSQ